MLNVKIDKILDTDSAIKGYATLYINDCFAVHNIKIIEGSKGIFAAMPSQSYQTKTGETKYTDICHATTSEMQKQIVSAVIDAYKKEIAKSPAKLSPMPIVEKDSSTPDLFEGIPDLSLADDVELPFSLDDEIEF